MSPTALEVVEKELHARLRDISHEYIKLDSLYINLTNLGYSAHHFNMILRSEYDSLVAEILGTEKHLLYMLVHLLDHVKKYCIVHKLKTSELTMVESFSLYRVASNYVNAIKHGPRGRGHITAYDDCIVVMYARDGNSPSTADKAIAVQNIINYGGELYTSYNMIEGLIILWRLFITFHVKIESDVFLDNTYAVLRRRMSLSSYKGNFPDGLKEYMSEQSAARSKLDI